MKKIRFSIDRGGTFTDIYAETPGTPGYRVIKLLSENPEHYDDAPREGIRRILEEETGRLVSPQDIDTSQIEWIRMGTTVATNALLERQGARCALIITKGFRDLLQIGYQNRPDIFDLQIQKPELLYETVVEINERVRLMDKKESGEDLENPIAQGITGELLEVLRAPDPNEIQQALQQIHDKGIRSIAVVLMHAYTYPDHERLIGKIAAKIGFQQISLSSEIMPMVKIVARGDTTVVDAYLTPHIQNYLNTFRQGFSQSFKPSELLFMQSDGGLAPANKFTGSRAILSGPAGGVVGHAMTTWNEKTRQPVIGFDMGGTSTDVSRFGGHYELVHETETSGVRIQAPQLNIVTVAAGGGSRLFFHNGMFKVGPESVGASPGPVCYRKNGYLAVTDANLVLGRLIPEYFPSVFGASADQSLDLESAQSAFKELQRQINESRLQKGQAAMSIEEIAHGFIQVANEVMVRPMREISVARGYDIKEHILVCFGGAAGQHACAIARSLGISKIFIHRFAGILSAYGMGIADVITERQEPSSLPYTPENLPYFSKRLTVLAEQASDELENQGFTSQHLHIEYYLNLRYEGTDTSAMILQPADKNYAIAFQKYYQREFGFELKNRLILVDDIRVRAIGKSRSLRRKKISRQQKPISPVAQTSCYFDEGWSCIDVFISEDLGAGATIQGPAIIIQDTSTIVVEPHCLASITDFGDIEIHVESHSERLPGTEADPIQLSIFSNLFMSIAEQMGRALQKTAISTNIKERLDFSCAIFDSNGGLVANAPHQPVHLGAMSEAVRQQLKIHGNNLKRGDVLVTNHPVSGGSHLPDITVITPVFQDNHPIFFVANRGHHADIGGISPGSMPPFSKRLLEEGACIKSFKLVENGIFQEEGIKKLLCYPETIPRSPDDPKISGARKLSDNLSDLKAQVAATQKGINLLQEMIDHYSLKVVLAYMQHIQNNAEEAVRHVLRKFVRKWGVSEVKAMDYLDDGSPIHLTLTVDADAGEATFDFTGTGPQMWGNCNTPRAVTHSAIIYALRCLIHEDIPLNQGCLNPVKIIIEEGSLLAPSEDAAVVGGNVLTSQRIVDVILKAFGAAAASQGCMNNLTFGNGSFGYYETIGGGAGAGPTWHGQSGVHTHMTNTRITDPEILERRYPVMLREFSIRQESGGKGRFQGGDGIIREIEFLVPLNVAILSERRVYAPYGLEGGKNGLRGKNLFIKNNGIILNLGSKNEIHTNPGDRILILTPGGGGFGVSEN